ncbi:MAG: FkbM family methyltransferase [Chryseobacterium sp.]|uniref:FkbM family methyltransferase n=1 Tax=Chryseobacterium sp. TaxID=1871047 RepID=UPI001B15CA6A|nr:FkbM family methyltransferase [Chryseobacterium sp.]MBO6183464.1 FkbM family methyltransferase [Chryseobacterium sp.]
MKKLSFFKKKKEIEPKIEEEIIIEYKVGKYKMFLKNNHMIEKYQAQFPLYDRFLPYFCSFFKGLIVDVGANIGDTSVAIFSQNDNCFIVGVEPDEDFFKDCLETIKINNLNDRFLGVQKFISTKKGAFIIEKDKTSSTGSINMSTSEIDDNTVSFAELSNLIPLEKFKTFDMLKIDTDGFDWDVINSFTETNDNLNHPRFIFFEMQTFLNNDVSKTLQRQEMNLNYINAIKKLKNKGYTHFSLFDNFGTYVMTTESVEDIIKLNEYVIRSQVNNHYSTIFYFDVLAYSERELDFTTNKISEFYVQNI